MLDKSRDLREEVVRVLAKLAMVWAIAVLGFLFTATATASAATGEAASATSGAGSLVTTNDAPSAAGLALIVAVLAAGALVLAVGCMRAQVAKAGRPVMDLRLAA